MRWSLVAALGVALTAACGSSASNQKGLCESDVERETVCNGVDDDCDGLTDEEITRVCPQQKGVCNGATTACVKGEYRACDRNVYGGDYVPDEGTDHCDGADNDCDGATDEGCSCNYRGRPAGVCAGRTRGADGTCPAPSNWEAPTPDESHCNGADNDCDGVVDEGCPCTWDDRPTGVCKTDKNAQGTCAKPASYEASEHSIADGRDNDCDGTADERNWQSIVAASNVSCGLLASGHAVCWGENANLQASPPSSRTFEQIDVGDFHGCGRTGAGDLHCWGSNSEGQFDAPPNTFEAVAVLNQVTCGLTTSGRARCWGSSVFGGDSPRPGNYRRLDAGPFHVCGLTTGGSINCWGRNHAGQAVAPGGTYQSVSAGRGHTCAVQKSGTVRCWGDNEFGEASPPRVGFREVAAGDEHTCGITTTGGLRCWGGNRYGQKNAPSGAFQEIAAGNRHTCGLTAGGTIRCWGYNRYGQSAPP